MAYPKTYRYTKEHEWIHVEGGLATIGITDYAQHELGDVVFVELPKPGAKIETGENQYRSTRRSVADQGTLDECH